ncbi:zf-HC2 domain-containing protein [Streptomyces sp. NPDC020681]|uniref:zf-HC2 domain-containing protein n=1 Tax=Streptomyces sp. NPDC020681 TaxID=3365083 RepID=UPI0037BCD8D1
MTVQEFSSEHEAVGAYALGVLDVADTLRFQGHLAQCDDCAQQLEEFMSLEPLLATLAETTPATVSDPAVLYVQPSPRLLDRLVDGVAVERLAQRRRSLCMVAAAAVLIIGGPVITIAVTSAEARTEQALPHVHSTSPAEDVFFNHMNDKTKTTDPVSKVTATVGTEEKAWGTHAVLELNNVKGPLKCSLIAVSKAGNEEVVASWSVPKWGYGIPDSADERGKRPLYVHGGAAMPRSDIDRFEVRSFEGKRLVEIDV